jgi:hypothetical protein
VSVQILAYENFQTPVTTTATLHHHPEQRPLNVFEKQDGNESQAKDDQQQQEIKNEEKPLHLVVEKCQGHAIVRYESKSQQHHTHDGLIKRQADVLKFLRCH